LKDWEERLWKTNPEQSDSDGDGVPDGEETKTGRNPALAPHNELFSEKSLAPVAGENTQGETNQTEALARDLFSSYLIGQKKTGSLTEGQVQGLASGFAERAENLYNPPVYTMSRVKTIDDSPSAMHKYDAELTAIFSGVVEHQQIVLSILREVPRTQNFELLKKLESSALYYETGEKKLLAMSVPQSAASLHLQLVNGMAGVGYMVRTLMHGVADPLIGAVALGQFESSTRALGVALRVADTLSHSFLKK
jgi:hypothetical protein